MSSGALPSVPGQGGAYDAKRNDGQVEIMRLEDKVPQHHLTLVIPLTDGSIRSACACGQSFISRSLDDVREALAAHVTQ